jgi:hypothetical protein
MYVIEIGSDSTKLHHDRFRLLSNITVITATNWEAVVLVLLIEGIYEVRL